MISTTNHWKIGLFVVASLTVAFGTLAWLGYGQLKKEFFEIITFIDEPVDGLDIGSPIKFRGVPIGQVANITVAGDKKHLAITGRIFTDSLMALGLREKGDHRPIQENPEARERIRRLRVQVVSSLLTGVSFLQTDFVDEERYPLPEYPFDIGPDDVVIHAIPSAYKTVERRLLDAVDKVPVLMEAAIQLMASLETGIADLSLEELSKDLRTLSQTMDQRLRTLDEMPLVSEGTAAIIELRTLLAELRDPEGRLNKALAAMDAMGRTVEVELKKAELGDTTGAFRGAAGEVAAVGRRLRTELDTLSETLGSIRRLMDLLERDPGALLRGRGEGK